jgi:DNA primase
MNELVEAVRSQAPIEAVIAEHVQLRRSGAQLRGRCLFHADKTPSLYISPAKGVFHCHGCGAGGDVFEFVRLLHQCSFRQSVELLAARTDIHIDGFRPPPELTAKVAALKAQREQQMEFQRFCDDRINGVNRQYRSLARAATHAEDYLAVGLCDSHIDDLAWAALERFRLFEAHIEREGLVDIEVLRTERLEQKRRGHYHAAA